MSTAPIHPVASKEDWLTARVELLKREKELTNLRDQLNAQRLKLPWVKVEKHYQFEGADGHQTLADLFDGRSQLIVQHFMFGPDWEEGCPDCSFGADHVDAARQHLEHHDVSYVAVSRAPYPKLAAFKRRMDWHFKWVSSFGSDFNFDYGVSFTEADKAKGRVYYNYEWIDYAMDELPGYSSFYKDPDTGDVFHTYSVFARGGEHLLGTFGFLDIAPKGRNETGPHFDMRDWVRHHDRYEARESHEGCCQKAANESTCCAAA